MIVSFKAAIHSRNKVSLSFYSKEDGRVITRLCAPMDFGPSRKAHDKSDRFHLWDYESDQKNHVLSLKSEQVRSITVVDMKFDPGEFVTWSTNWIVKRDWGRYS